MSSYNYEALGKALMSDGAKGRSYIKASKKRKKKTKKVMK